MIVICEPQCKGLEHIMVNSALIIMIKHIFPYEKILFIAEMNHIKNIKEIIDNDVIDIEYKSIIIPPRYQSSLWRFSLELKIARDVFTFASNSNIDKVLFCSITSPGLISIKLLLKSFKRIKCMIIPHAILESIYRPPLKVTELLFWFRIWISIDNSEKLHYILLSPCIKNELIKQLPHLNNYISAIDLPYIYKNINSKSLECKDNIIKFGFFGVGSYSKGIEAFFDLAKNIKEHKSKLNAKFILVGRISNAIERKLNNGYVQILSIDKPLSDADFMRYSAEIDYAIFLHNYKRYRLSASGSIFDALSNLTPIIALNNPQFKYFFDKLGDIGYLCDDAKDIELVILNLLNNMSTERYLVQSSNLARAKDEFDIKKIGKKIRPFWGN